MDKDFAYLLGAFGDGCIYQQRQRGEYCIEYEQKVEAWLANSVSPRFEKLYGKKPSVKKRNAKGMLFRLRLYSKKAFFEIKNAMQNLHLLLIEETEVKANFIRGFFDAEGSVPKRKHGTSYRLEIYQKDTSKLELIAKMLLKDFGIKPNRLTNSRDIGQLNIRGVENISKFRDLIGSGHPAKASSLRGLF